MNVRVCVILPLAFLLLFAWSEGHAQKVRLKVRDVSFQGNNTYSEGRLQDLMVMKPSGFLSSTDFHQEVLDDDVANIENFYHQQGFLEARVTNATVTADSAEEDVDLHIRISEGARTRISGITLSGSTLFPPEQLLKIIDLHPGDPLLGDKLRDGLLAIVTLYADSGYLAATVQPGVNVDSAAHVAGIHVQVIERFQYRVGEIIVKGAVKTKEYVIRRELLIDSGDVVEYARLLESQRRLYLTGLFESAFVHPDSAENPHLKNIVVEVREKLSGDFNVAVGYGSVEKIRGKLQVSTSNLQGTGRSLGINLNANFINQEVEGALTEPWTFGTSIRTDATAYFRLQQEPAFDIRRYGGRVAVGHEIGLRSHVSLTYRYENAILSNLQTTILPQDFRPRVRSLTLTFTNDKRDDPFNSTKGTYFQIDDELAGAFLKGTNSFVRSRVRFKAFHPFSTNTIIGTSIDLGYIYPFKGTEVPLSERFYAGGPNVLRAFDYERIGPLDPQNTPLGGTILLVWNVAELRQTIWKFLGGVFFIDVGQVWAVPESMHLRDIRIAVGPGLRVNTPIGMVRLDWGLNIFPEKREAKSKIFFNMGQAF